MYEVVSIKKALVTRFPVLKNCETGNVYKCFDDSGVVSDTNFWFMKEGGKYDCKIQLFGDVVPEMKEGAVLCQVAERDIMVGKRTMVKVLVGEEPYYIHQYKINNLAEGECLYYDLIRRDLIQVGDVIHASFLEERKWAINLLGDGNSPKKL